MFDIIYKTSNFLLNFFAFKRFNEEDQFDTFKRKNVPLFSGTFEENLITYP